MAMYASQQAHGHRIYASIEYGLWLVRSFSGKEQHNKLCVHIVWEAYCWTSPLVASNIMRMMSAVRATAMT